MLLARVFFLNGYFRKILYLFFIHFEMWSVALWLLFLFILFNSVFWTPSSSYFSPFSCLPVAITSTENIKETIFWGIGMYHYLSPSLFFLPFSGPIFLLRKPTSLIPFPVPCRNWLWCRSKSSGREVNRSSLVPVEVTACIKYGWVFSRGPLCVHINILNVYDIRLMFCDCG